jgi:L-threonylcarbamoyladenylate synthase
VSPAAVVDGSGAAAALAACIAAGGVAVFPADTVYGLACDPCDQRAVESLYALKGRRPDKPSAVMFFSVAAALEALTELGPRTRAAVQALMPGAVSLLVPNPRRRFPLACPGDRETLGLRVPEVPLLAQMPLPVLQSSANLSGGKDPRRLQDVPEALRAAVDLCVDGGELPGRPSTVIDVRELESRRRWHVVRAGAVSAHRLEEILGAPPG